MADNVKVAVRVRPFNDREKNRKASLVIKMTGNTTEITDPENSKAGPKKFTFDYSYWSHDGFKQRSDGYLEPDSAQYADQQKVFNDLGQGVLDNSWKGYNCSLFAYGQTGSGKSYSMVGYGANKGIVPISCEELFKGIEEKRKTAQKGEEYQVTFSMIEIYNEQVRDLLNASTMKIKGGLKVRQHPNKGFYVEKMTVVPVNSYSEINNKMNEGTKNRTVASTNMNATSSRAHTIVAINFTQKAPNPNGESMTKTSSINLVDLAGSERAASTGATGDRLKEGSSINLSLSTLGNCIKALADSSSGKKNVTVPYRNSVLTKLLKNALGGNSKTVMIAALSPADINYEETLSTLRFADRAKAIKTKAVVNESATDKLIRELREENARLLKMLKEGGVPDNGGLADGMADQDSEALQKEMEELIRKNAEDMEAMQKSWEQRMSEKDKEYKDSLAAEKKKEEQKKVVPHFWNLNEDPSLSGIIVHFTPAGRTKIGSDKPDKKPDIILTGLGIQDKHAVIHVDKKKVVIQPCPGAKVMLNGNEIKDKKELHHNDRVLFGSSNLFVFHHPQDYAAMQKTGKETAKPTYASAQEEIAANSGFSLFTNKRSTKDDMLLHEDLIEIWPMVNQANAMSEELDKKVKFEIALINPQTLGKKTGRTEVYVTLRNMENGHEFLWDRNTFINRKYMMQEMYQNYVDGDKEWDKPKEEDPFWEDPSTPVLIGTVYVYLQSLAHKIELDESLAITDYKFREHGRLNLSMYPCEKDGTPSEDFVESPDELIGKDFYVNFGIQSSVGISRRFVKVFCKYKFYIDGDYNMTEEVTNQDFKYHKKMSFEPVTKQFVDYLMNDMMVIELWGRQQIEADRPAPNRTLSTKELMVKDSQRKDPPVVKPEEIQKLYLEASTSRKRADRAEYKLRKVRELVAEAKKKEQAEIKVADIEQALRSGVRLKAVASLIAQTQRSKMDNMGKGTSQACSIQ